MAEAVDAMTAVRSCRGRPASKFGGLIEDLAWSSDEWKSRQGRPRKAVKKDHTGCGSSLDAGAAGELTSRKTQIRMMAAPLDVVLPLRRHISECY